MTKVTNKTEFVKRPARPTLREARGLDDPGTRSVNSVMFQVKGTKRLLIKRILAVKLFIKNNKQQIVVNRKKLILFCIIYNIP